MRDFKDIKRVIIKVGSSSLVNKDLSVNNEIIISILSVFKKLKNDGIECALVTSGAIALGMHELKLN